MNVEKMREIRLWLVQIIGPLALAAAFNSQEIKNFAYNLKNGYKYSKCKQRENDEGKEKNCSDTIVF